MEALEQQQGSSVVPPPVVEVAPPPETSLIAESNRLATMEMLALDAPPPPSFKLLKIGGGFMCAALAVAMSGAFMPAAKAVQQAAPQVATLAKAAQPIEPQPIAAADVAPPPAVVAAPVQKAEDLRPAPKSKVQQKAKRVTRTVARK